MNKQNKRKLYTFRHMWLRQALKPANDTRDQALNYANNNKNDVWNAEIPSAALRSVYGTNSKYIGANPPPTECPKIEVKKKTTLQPGNRLVKLQTTNTCIYVAAQNGRTVKQSHCETV